MSWTLVNVDDVALVLDSTDKLYGVVPILHVAFQLRGLLSSIGKTKTPTMYLPNPGKELLPVPGCWLWFPLRSSAS